MEPQVQRHQLGHRSDVVVGVAQRTHARACHPRPHRVVVMERGALARLVPAGARLAHVVEESGDELADLEAVPGELQALAERTGGRAFLGVSDVPPLSELASTTRRAVGLVSKQPLSNPWFIFLTIAVLGLTWVLRRRWGRR